MITRKVRLTATIAFSTAAVAFATALGISLSTGTATAGIGPAGFAYYARQGINHGQDLAYGKGHRAWDVTCTERPNYRAMSDVVTCKITIKP